MDIELPKQPDEAAASGGRYSLQPTLGSVFKN